MAASGCRCRQLRELPSFFVPPITGDVFFIHTLLKRTPPAFIVRVPSNGPAQSFFHEYLDANRAEPVYTSFLAELVADLQRAIDRALRLGVGWDDLIVDPGFGFGKTPDHNLELFRELGVLELLGRPILLGTSRKSTLGRVLDLPAGERLEATLATTALGVAGGTDIVRVHDVRANVRVARISDAIVRGTWRPDPTEGGAS